MMHLPWPPRSPGCSSTVPTILRPRCRSKRRAHGSGQASVQLSVPPATALLHLRVTAFSHNESLTEPARAVVSRRLRFDDPSDRTTAPDESKD